MDRNPPRPVRLADRIDDTARRGRGERATRRSPSASRTCVRAILGLYGAGLERTSSWSPARTGGSSAGWPTTSSSARCWCSTTCIPTTSTPASRPPWTRSAPTWARTPAASRFTGVDEGRRAPAAGGQLRRLSVVRDDGPERHRGRDPRARRRTSSPSRWRAWCRDGPALLQIQPFAGPREGGAPGLGARRRRRPARDGLARPRRGRAAPGRGVPASDGARGLVAYRPAARPVGPTCPGALLDRLACDVRRCARFDLRLAGRSADGDASRRTSSRSRCSPTARAGACRWASRWPRDRAVGGLGGLRRLAAPRPPAPDPRRRSGARCVGRRRGRARPRRGHPGPPAALRVPPLLPAVRSRRGRRRPLPRRRHHRRVVDDLVLTEPDWGGCRSPSSWPSSSARATPRRTPRSIPRRAEPPSPTLDLSSWQTSWPQRRPGRRTARRRGDAAAAPRPGLHLLRHPGGRLLRAGRHRPGSTGSAWRRRRGLGPHRRLLRRPRTAEPPHSRAG